MEGIEEIKVTHIQFSIILPVYNVSDYLEQCMASLLPQLCDDTEIIFIDDGSTDGSGALCDRYAQEFPAVFVFHQSNRGVAAARNEGVRRARGAYILWVDPDDYVADDWLATIRQEIGSYDMLFFDYVKCINGACEESRYGRAPGDLSSDEFLYELSRDDAITSVLWNKVIRTEAYLLHPFDEQLRSLEDYDVLYRIAAEQKRIRYVCKCLYTYRILEGGLVRSPNLQIGYMCYQKSVERYNVLISRISAPSRLGICLQAKGFLCKYYRCSMPPEWKNEADICRSAIAACYLELLFDRRLPATDKLKYMFIRFSPIGRVYARKKG